MLTRKSIILIISIECRVTARSQYGQEPCTRAFLAGGSSSSEAESVRIANSTQALQTQYGSSASSFRNCICVGSFPLFLKLQIFLRDDTRQPFRHSRHPSCGAGAGGVAGVTTSATTAGGGAGALASMVHSLLCSRNYILSEMSRIEL